MSPTASHGEYRYEAAEGYHKSALDREAKASARAPAKSLATRGEEDRAEQPLAIANHVCGTPPGTRHQWVDRSLVLYICTCSMRDIMFKVKLSADEDGRRWRAQSPLQHAPRRIPCIAHRILSSPRVNSEPLRYCSFPVQCCALMLKREDRNMGSMSPSKEALDRPENLVCRVHGDEGGEASREMLWQQVKLGRASAGHMPVVQFPRDVEVKSNAAP